MYLTRQASAFLLFISMVAAMSGIFGMLKSSQADEPPIVIDGSVESFFDTAGDGAVSAEVLGQGQLPEPQGSANATDGSATGGGEALGPDIAPADTTTTTTAAAPLLDASNTVSARPEDFTFEGGPQPVSLRIAQVNIEAGVVEMGLNDERGLATPPAEQIGWYKHGPAPGETGSSVLAAHVDWGGRPGAFFELRNVVPGDRIEIDYDDGSTSAFEVIASRQYAKASVPKEQLFDRTGQPRLVLVTCGGAFDNSIGHYADNFVAFARPVAA